MRGRQVAAVLVAAVAVAAAAAGCSSGDVSTSPAAAVIVTFEVNEGERFRVLLTEPADQAAASRLLAGEEGPDIPNGRIVRRTGVNEGWSWSIDPSDFEFADVTMEACDGNPSDVESGELTSERYCPWSARVLLVEPAP
jgi:hypothetical protein